jgi:hypothetical protein
MVCMKYVNFNIMYLLQNLCISATTFVQADEFSLLLKFYEMIYIKYNNMCGLLGISINYGNIVECPRK